MKFLFALILALLGSAVVFLVMASLIAPAKVELSEPKQALAIKLVDRFETKIEAEKINEPEPETPPPPKLPTPVVQNNTPDIEAPNISFDAAPLSDFAMTGLQKALAPTNELGDIKISRDAVVIAPVKPQYPPNAARRKIEGNITLEFTIDEKGRAQGIRIIEATVEKVFDRVAISAVKRSKYQPVEFEGQVISTPVIQTFEFTL